MATWINRGHFYVPHVMPVLVDCTFTVTPSNGLGITGLKGQGVTDVFMHTSTTPAVGNSGITNPNPDAGIIMVKLADNFSKLYHVSADFWSPNGAATTSSKANVINVITVLGTATLAQWQAVGLPPGITPAVGVSFIGSQAAVIGGSAQTAIVLAAGASIDHIEVAGNPNLTISPAPVGGTPYVGGFLYLSCYEAHVLSAPVTTSTIQLSFYLSQSSVVVSGE